MFGIFGKKEEEKPEVKIDQSVMNNLIGHNFGRGIYLSKKDMLNMVDTAVRYIKSNVLPTIQEMEQVISAEDKKDRIVSTVSYRPLGLRDDLELLYIISKITEDWVDSSRELKKKIDDLVPEYISVNTSDLNLKLLLSVLGMGVFFAHNLPYVLAYWLSRFYNKSKDLKPYRSASKYAMSLADVIKNLRKVKLKDVIDTIGKFPNIKVSKNEVPSQVVLDFAKRNLKISSRPMLAFIGQALNLLKKDMRAKMTKNNYEARELIGSSGFIGNPIYHIRLFLTDLEVNQYKKLEDEKRLLELKVAELKAKQQGNEDPDLQKQIEYYEQEIKKTEDKIDTILKDVKLNRKNQ